MKKRLVPFLLGLSMIAALVGCGSTNTKETANVTVKDYKGLEIQEVAVLEVTDKDVEEEIALALEGTVSKFGIKDREAKDGDAVLIDYEGKLNGKAFEGGTAEEYILPLGSGTFIPGFEEQIVGHKPGETFDIKVTFPEDYDNEELKGKETVFTVKLHAIAPTELTDDIATYLTGEETTVEEYRKIIKENLEAANAENAVAEYENNVYMEFLKNCSIDKYPEDEVKSVSEDITASYGMLASMYGMETEEFVKEFFNLTIEEMAKEQVLYRNALLKVAELEKIELTDKDYEEKTASLAEEYGYENADDYIKDYEEQRGEGSLRTSLLQDKVMEWIIDNSVKIPATEKAE